MDKEDFIKYECKFAKLFLNSRKQNRLANAYLLYGSYNAPLKDVALFIAKSLNCKNDLLACDNCLECDKFNKGIWQDFTLIDGENGTIKKEDVKKLEEDLSHSSFSKTRKLIYLINKVENMTSEAINALLKFLEEPKAGQLALLTTNNTSRVLPTIVSRCLLVRIDPINPKLFYEKLCETEVAIDKKKVTLSTFQAYCLSKLFPTEEAVLNAINEYDILKVIDIAEMFFNHLATSYKQGCYILLKEVGSLDNKCYNWLYLVLEMIFTSCLLDKIDNTPFNSIIESLKDYKNLNKAVEILKQAISLKQINPNPTLVLSKMLLSLEYKKQS